MLTLVALAALLVAVIALALVRRQGRQLARLTEMYWQLKYEHGELRATVLPAPDTPPAPPTTTFVPLGSVKRSQS